MHVWALASDRDDVYGSGVDVGGGSLYGEALIWRECRALWLAVRRPLGERKDDDDGTSGETLGARWVCGRVTWTTRTRGCRRYEERREGGDV